MYIQGIVYKHISMTIDQQKTNPNENPKGGVEIKKEKYLDLVNDFGFFITLNAARLDQQILPGKKNELDELQTVLRKPIINGLNYADFTSKNFNKLTEPQVGQALLAQIYNFLLYIEPRLDMFKADSSWVTRYKDIRQKYNECVNSMKP